MSGKTLGRIFNRQIKKFSDNLHRDKQKIAIYPHLYISKSLQNVCQNDYLFKDCSLYFRRYCLPVWF